MIKDATPGGEIVGTSLKEEQHPEAWESHQQLLTAAGAWNPSARGHDWNTDVNYIGVIPAEIEEGVWWEAAEAGGTRYVVLRWWYVVPRWYAGPGPHNDGWPRFTGYVMMQCATVPGGPMPRPSTLRRLPPLGVQATRVSKG